MTVTYEDVLAARRTIEGHVRRTDIAPLTLPDQSIIYLKTECLQYTGSFKVRGAYNKMLSLSEEERRHGVIAASAGNHAQGVALAAKTMGIQAIIVMPRFAPLQKITATERLGAKVILHGDVFDDAYAYALEQARERHMVLIHAFDDPYVIAGQGTMALEILEDVPDVSTIFLPIGGGGMAAGIGVAVKSIRPDIRLVGVEPRGAASMKSSFDAKHLMKLPNAATIADGVAVKSPGTLNYELCKSYLDDILTVEEDEIARTILYLMERGKLVVEGAGAVPIAALLFGHYDTHKHKTVAIASGGNIDVTMLARIIDRGLLKAGRKVTLQTNISDRPGELSDVLQSVSQTGANIVNIHHERSRAHLELKEVRLEFTLETRDRAHISAIIHDLNTKGYHVKALK